MYSKLISRFVLVPVFTINLGLISSIARAQNIDDLIFYEGNGCTQDIVFTYNSHVDADDNCKKSGSCKGDNDEARSVKINKTVNPNAQIVVFDDPGGSQDDDQTIITIVDKDFLEPEGYCLRTFENSFDNPNSNSGIKVEYNRKNGLDGKISRVRVIANPPGLTSAPLSLSVRSAMLTVAHSGQCLDVAEASQEAGAPIVQWPCHGGANQAWSLKGSQGSALVVTHSGQCLDVAGGSQEAGAPIIQWPCHDGANQSWALHPLGDGAFTITSTASGLCLDVTDASPNAGTRLIQWPCNGSANQVWSRR